MKPRVVVAVTARTALDVVVGQVDHLQSSRWDVHVVVGEEAPEMLFPKARLHVLPMNRGIARGSDALALRRWWSLLRDLRPDVVVAATPKAAFLGLSAAWAVGVPHRIWWAWGLRSEGETRGSVRRAERITAASATSVVAASASLASSIASATGSEPVVLGQGAIAGVDLDVFTPAERPTTRPIAVYVGRLAKDKGMEDLAAIWQAVADRVPGAELWIAGSPDPLDPPSAAWDAFIQRGDVKVLGWVDDVAGLLAQTRVLLLPSAREGMPAVVLEAGACGVPTVAWDVTGSRDAVAHGLTGYLCERGHRDQFAARAVELLGDATLAQHLGKAARAHVATHYDRRDVEHHFEEHLRHLLGWQQPSPAPASHQSVKPAEPHQPSVVDLTSQSGEDTQSPATTASK